MSSTPAFDMSSANFPIAAICSMEGGAFAVDA
jgi:hypothetical protein